MEEIIRAITRLLSENKVKEAVSKLESTGSVHFVPISNAYRRLEKKWLQGKIRGAEFEAQEAEIVDKILVALQELSPKDSVNKAGEKDTGMDRAKQEQPVMPSQSDKEPKPLNKPEHVMEEQAGNDPLEELMIISLHFEFFDWTQRDYLGKLGGLLQQADRHLRSLPDSPGDSFHARRTKQLLHDVVSKNRETRDNLFKILRGESGELLTRTRNVDLPKLALQLESLVEHLQEKSASFDNFS